MSGGENYGQFLNMLDLVLWLQESGQVGLTEIAERFGVSRRTAERMRDAVANYFGGDFQEEREGARKYFKLRTRRLDAVIMGSLAKEELAAFAPAVQLLRRHNMEGQARALEQAGAKLRGLAKLKEAQRVDLEDLMRSGGLARRPGPRLRYDEELVRRLGEARLSFHLVRATYADRRGLERDYVLIPLGFLYGERQHYLVARHADGYGGAEPRHFVLSRLKAVEILPDVFEEDKNFSLDDHAAKSFGSFQEEPFEVEWLFSQEAADEAENYLFHPTQTARRNPDGSLTVRFVAGGRLEMAWHLHTWGGRVKVVKPADFWETLPDF